MPTARERSPPRPRSCRLRRASPPTTHRKRCGRRSPPSSAMQVVRTPRSRDRLRRSSACPMPSRTLARPSGRSAGCSRSSRASGRSSSSSTICTGRSHRLLELLEFVADWAREVPILLLCLARPDLLDERPHWGGGRANAGSSLLEPLGAPESELHARGPWRLRACRKQSGGGSSRRRRGTRSSSSSCSHMPSEAAAGDEEVSIPPTIQALLAARLDALEPQERETLERAAVVGQRFSSAAVAALLPAGPADRLPELILALVRKELLRPDPPHASGEEAFRFRHALIREAAYERMPKETRAELHERYAGWLEEAAGEPSGELEETIGYHLEQACRHYGELGLSDERTHQLARRASVRLASAGQAAVYRDTPVASSLLERAAALLPAEDAARLEILPELAEALFLAGKLAQATGRLRGGDRGGRTPGRPPNPGSRARRSPRLGARDRPGGRSGSGTTRGRRRAGGLRGGRGRTRPRPSVESVRSIGFCARTDEPGSRCVRTSTRARAASATRAPAGADARLCECRTLVRTSSTSTRSPGKASKPSIGPAPTATGPSRRTCSASHSASAMRCGDASTVPAGRSSRRKRSSRTSAAAVARPTYVTQRPTSSCSQATRLRRSASCARGTSSSRRRATDPCNPSMQRALPLRSAYRTVGAKLTTGPP